MKKISICFNFFCDMSHFFCHVQICCSFYLYLSTYYLYLWCTRVWWNILNTDETFTALLGSLRWFKHIFKLILHFLRYIWQDNLMKNINPINPSSPSIATILSVKTIILIMIEGLHRKNCGDQLRYDVISLNLFYT